MWVAAWVAGWVAVWVAVGVAVLHIKEQYKIVTVLDGVGHDASFQTSSGWIGAADSVPPDEGSFSFLVNKS